MEVGVARCRAGLVLAHPGGLFTTHEWNRLRRICRLSPRQQQVAQLICEAYDAREIAEQLGLSVDTVRLHMKGLFARLGVGNRVGVVMALVRANRSVALRECRIGEERVQHACREA
jgi:DNA-binding CsgD family transcriptional regulator